MREIDGPIRPATSDYVARTVEEAEGGTVELLILQMNTPGGLDQAMRKIIQAILASDVPLVCCVAPPVRAHTSFIEDTIKSFHGEG